MNWEDIINAIFPMVGGAQLMAQSGGPVQFVNDLVSQLFPGQPPAPPPAVSAPGPKLTPPPVPASAGQPPAAPVPQDVVQAALAVLGQQGPAPPEVPGGPSYFKNAQGVYVNAPGAAPVNPQQTVMQAALDAIAAQQKPEEKVGGYVPTGGLSREQALAASGAKNYTPIQPRAAYATAPQTPLEQQLSKNALVRAPMDEAAMQANDAYNKLVASGVPSPRAGELVLDYLKSLEAKDSETKLAIAQVRANADVLRSQAQAAGTLGSADIAGTARKYEADQKTFQAEQYAKMRENIAWIESQTKLSQTARETLRYIATKPVDAFGTLPSVDQLKQIADQIDKLVPGVSQPAQLTGQQSAATGAPTPGSQEVIPKVAIDPTDVKKGVILKKAGKTDTAIRTSYRNAGYSTEQIDSIMNRVAAMMGSGV